MEKKSTKTPLYKRVFNFLKTKRTRNTVFLLLILFAILSMFFIDEFNYFRDTKLAFLNDNFLSDLLGFFGIKRYDVVSSSWILFGAIITVALMMLIGNIVAPKFVEKKVKQNRSLFSTEKKAKVFYSALFYGVLFLIAVAIIVAAYLIGASFFGKFYGKNPYQKPLLDLLTMIAIFLVILLLIPVALLLVYYAIKFIIFCIVLLLRAINNTNKAFDDNYDDDDDDEDENTANTGATTIAESTPPTKKEEKGIFSTLIAIDNANLESKPATFYDQITLEDFVKQFQSFAIHKHKIYYELPMLRQFIAGLGASRLIILEGLSGTGKSMLPRMFKEFTGSEALFTPVQATWRDKTDVLGFYSEFTGTFKATPFLEKLYAASYDDKVNLFVLDEMNLSRIEYYFADFLSIMEYPEEDWKVKIYLPFDNSNLPAKLDNGFVQIPSNSWFIGTANTDDSTFTITDKVCDRAIILNFEDRFSKIDSDTKYEPVPINAANLKQLFNEALADESKHLNDRDVKKFETLCDYIKDRFDVLFGNRIMVQIEKFVPIYVALGGTKEEALDFMFAKKILRKLEGKYEAYLKDELIALKPYIDSLYGKGVFKETERFINKTIKKLG